MRGTTMWLPFTWRTRAWAGSALTSSCTCFTHGPAAAEMVIQEQTRAYHPCRPQMRLVRQHELQRCDDMWRGAEKHFALGQGLGHEPKFVVLEIAQAAVDQLRAPRRGMRGQIVL